MSVRGRTTRRSKTADRLLAKIVHALTSPSATGAWIWLLMTVRGFLSSDRRSHLGKVHSILVIRLDAIGDVLLTGPFLRELRGGYPRARITLVVAPRVLNLVETCPYVDRALIHHVPPATRWWHPLSRRLIGLSFARRELWPELYDMAVVPRWGEDHYEATILARLSGAPDRVGYAARTKGRQRERSRYDRFLTRLVDDRSVKHEVQRNVDLLSEMGVPAPSLQHTLEVWLTDEDRSFANRIVTSSNAAKLVALGPGAGSPKRMWAIERVEEVGRWLADGGARLVVVGGPGDEGLGEHLSRRIGDEVIDLTNRATIRETAAVLAHCSLFCGNDSGPMHLAAAVGVPIVEISCHPLLGDELHPNSPSRFGPWGVSCRVVQPDRPKDGCSAGCRVESPHCILNVRVDSVIAAIESLRVETSVVEGSAGAS
jgi:ADP-heptose:LPS heptosyltransferase